MLAAQRNAEALASRDTPRYPSQARTTDAGIASANASLRSQEPAPNPVREGTSVIRTKPNDTKGNELVSRQVQLEQLGLTNQAQYDNATNSGRVKRRRNEDY